MCKQEMFVMGPYVASLLLLVCCTKVTDILNF